MYWYLLKTNRVKILALTKLFNKNIKIKYNNNLSLKNNI